MPDFTEIIADDRESTSGIFEHLRSFSDVRLHIERLLTGDYIVDNTIIFERKAAADFAESLIDTRLFCQARRLANQSLRGAFIIEGSASDWCKLRERREALQGALLTLSLVFDLPVFRSRDINVDHASASVCWTTIRPSASRRCLALSSIQSEAKAHASITPPDDAAWSRN
jgi:ERCC4-type nuclease